MGDIHQAVSNPRLVQDQSNLSCPFCCSDIHFCNFKDLCEHKSLEHKQTKLQCFLCEYSTRKIRNWVKHFSKKHSTEAWLVTQLALSSCGISSYQREVSASCNSRRKGYTFQKTSKQGTESTNLRAALNSEPVHIAKLERENMTSENFPLGFSASNTSNLSHGENNHVQNELGFMNTKLNDSEHVVRGPQTSSSTYKCSKCGETFLNQKKCTRHESLHCSYCPYIASSPGRLKVHIRIHTGEKPHTCPYCEFRAADKVSVTFHIRTHTGERPFPCNMCDYAARTGSQLISHKLRHTGVRPYHCSRCGIRFTQAGSLSRHIKSEICVKMTLPLL